MKKSTLYYLGTLMAFGVIVLSVVQDVKPEWFLWLEPWVSQDTQGLQAMLKGLGFGGLVGIPGYALVETVMKKSNVANLDFTNALQTRVNSAEDHFAKVHEKIEKHIDDAIQGFNDGIQTTKTAVEKVEARAAELLHQVEHLESELQKAVQVIIAMAKSKAENPLQVPEIAKAINDALSIYEEAEDEEKTES